jgi:teneurin
LSISPADGHLYVSNPEKHQILRVISLEQVSDPSVNFESAVGSGERCIPGDETNCGDEGPAKDAKLAHPKGKHAANSKCKLLNLSVV